MSDKTGEPAPYRFKQVPLKAIEYAQVVTSLMILLFNGLPGPIEPTKHVKGFDLRCS